MTGVSPSRYNGPMAVELSVVAPCYNEEDNVEELVARVFAMFRAHEIDGELVLVDDGSTDDTWPALRAASQEHDNVVVVSHEKNAGITEAWTTGLGTSTGRYIVTIDADMQYRPEDVPDLYRKIAGADYDLVQGWRETYKDDSLLGRFSAVV